MKDKITLIILVLVIVAGLCLLSVGGGHSEVSPVIPEQLIDSTLLKVRAKSKEIREKRLEAEYKFDSVASVTKVVLENKLAKVIATNKQLDEQIAARKRKK